MNAARLLACEPIPFAFALFAGPGATEAYFLRGVGVLAIVVAIKSAIFGCYLREHFGRAVFAMLLANLVSTVVGFVVGALAGSAVLVIGAAIATWIIVDLAATRVGEPVAAAYPLLKFPAFLGISSFVLTFAGCLTILLGVTQSVPDGHFVPWIYWIAKPVGAFLILIPSLLLTILVEFTIAAALMPAVDRPLVFRAAARATLWTFFGVFFIAAAVALPKRLRRPGYLMAPGR